MHTGSELHMRPAEHHNILHTAMPTVARLDYLYLQVQCGLQILFVCGSKQIKLYITNIATNFLESEQM